MDRKTDKVTIRDIAEQAGVSIATVSRVINRNGYVKEETRKLVEDMIDKYNYAPSATARNLSRQQSSSVGVVVPRSNDSFFSDVLDGITMALEELDLNMILYHTRNRKEYDEKALVMLREHQVKGVVFTPAHDYQKAEDRQRLFPLIDGLGAPVVLLDRPIAGVGLDGVFFDNFRAAYLATEALILAGHRDIVVFALDQKVHIGRERLSGCLKAMEDYSLPLGQDTIVSDNCSTDSTYKNAKKILQANRLPTAFVLCNNISTLGFLRAVYETNYRVGKDFAYMGIDRIDVLDMIDLKLSCVDRDTIQTGQAAVELLLQRISDPDSARREVMIEPQLRLTGSERLPK